MSEELELTKPIKLDKYHFWKLDITTVSQLRKKRIVDIKFTSDIGSKRPDGIFYVKGGSIKAILECKSAQELNSPSKIATAIKQEIEVAKQLCKILIVTDGKSTYWINALNGEYIVNEKGEKVSFVFNPNEDLTKERIKELERLIDKIENSITDQNSKIIKEEQLDPSSLAKAMWQKIYVNTGKEPTKCLYNVVELFLFKFLSDLGVLSGRDSFDAIYEIISQKVDGKRSNEQKLAQHKEALIDYSHIRKKIKDLFPASPEDGTTIINGTIFVNEKGDPNVNQASLFAEVLEDLHEYGKKYGSFKNIKREFKTRLYETFLRQGAGIRTLGQFFTTRNVVRAMVSMSNIKNLKKGARICDPFCGVGGFLLEAIVENENILREFEPKNGKISPSIEVIGFDKGSDEKDEERTIILAKANMLIYLSDLIAKYKDKNYLKAFAEDAFNKVFVLVKTNLGTLGRTQEKPCDLILTNPPYVTSGSASTRKQIELQGLDSYYSLGGRGIEALSIEWIVNNLNEDGECLVILPDGLLNQKKVIDFLFKETNLRAIVSLPVRTFYATPKKTYILVFNKKFEYEKGILQKTPIFTYLVSEIGETRDAKRFPIEDKNDLKELVSLFTGFKGNPSNFESQSKRCKVFSVQEVLEKPNLLCDRWWSDEEKQEIGIEEEVSELIEEDFYSYVDKVFADIQSFKEYAEF